MVFTYFLSYFKPYRYRLLVAVLGMLLIGALTAAPLLIFREAADIFTSAGAGKGETSAELSHLSKLLDHSDSSPQPAEQTTGEAASDQSKMKRLKDLKDSLKSWSAPVYDPVNRWIKDKKTRFKAWYEPQKKNNPFTALTFMTALLIVLMLIKGIATFISKYQLSYTFFMTNLQMREDLFANILRQDYLYFNTNSSGYLHSRINSDVKNIQMIMEGGLSDGIQQPITIIVMVAFLFWLSMPLSIIILLVLPVVGGLLYYFAKVLRKNVTKQKRESDKLSATMTESLNNIRLIKAMGSEAIEVEKFHMRTMKLFKHMMAQRIAKFASSPIMETLGVAAGGGVLLMGAWMILCSTPPMMKFADFLTYLLAISRLFRPLKSLASLTNKYQSARVSADRMLQIFELQPMLKDAPSPKPFRNVQREIAFENVQFSYSEETILKDINLTVAAGQSVALVGPSGSGKTTLVNLVARLLDPTRGRILVDGTDLRELSLKDWRRHLAIVTQETILFDDTVANNIAYGCDTVDMERVQAAAQAANAHPFIMELDGGAGYQTRVGTSGANLSGGQRQRLAIARAIYRDPQILILDEATSALDNESQAIVQQALNQLMKGRTTFVIAHRISTIRDVDCIYVLTSGRVAEHGSHESLVARGGLYAAMVARAHGRDTLVENVPPQEGEVPL